MDGKRAFEILSHREICDVYYKNQPVWIQEIEKHTAKIGFIDGMEEQEVPLEDLYE